MRLLLFYLKKIQRNKTGRGGYKGSRRSLNGKGWKATWGALWSWSRLNVGRAWVSNSRSRTSNHCGALSGLPQMLRTSSCIWKGTSEKGDVFYRLGAWWIPSHSMHLPSAPSSSEQRICCLGGVPIGEGGDLCVSPSSGGASVPSVGILSLRSYQKVTCK